MKLVIENENKFRKAIFLGLFLASLLILCVRSDAQATYQAYQNPKIQLFDNLGAIASGFKLCSFAAGTTTPLITYADNAGTPNSNPVVLDGNGRAVVYTGASAYKFILYDASGNSSCPNSGVQLWSQDNVSNLAQLLLAGNNTWTGINIFANSGAFSNSAMSIPLQSNVNSCNPTTEYQATELGNYATAGISGCVLIPNTSTVHEADGALGMVNVTNSATIGAGVRGQARCTVNNAICEGNVAVVEDTGGLTGHSMLGAEIDLPLNGSPTLLEGLRILTVNGGGSVPASSWGVHVLPLLAGGGGYRLLGGAFYSEDNISDTGLILGSKTVSANSDSQDLYFHTRDAGNVMRTLILRVPSSLVANRIVEFGDPGGTDFVAYIGAAQILSNKTIASPTITGNATQGGLTAPLTQKVVSGTSAMTTVAITTGTCGSTVTVAATGALTTDTIEIANNTAVSTPNGLLTLNKWVTAGNVNFNYCNPTAGSLTPAAATINWAVIR